MNKTFIKVFTMVFILAGCIVVLFFGSPTSEPVFARTLAIAHLPMVDSKELPKNVTLGKDSTSEHGEVAFDHDSHSFKKYSPDGKTDIACVECHHTDQPASALKPPLATSERKEVLTVESLKKADAAPVKSCRSCHFQEGADIPEGKTQAVGIYKDAKGKEEKKELNSEQAYHINCNTCHDEAAKLRPELKKKPGFATGNDCFICHKKN